jgi:succinylglutamate desuccinylase
VEAGQHHETETIDNHESVLWMTLVTLGLLDGDKTPEYGVHRRRLRHAGRGLPAVVEVLHRHPIDPDDGFRMVEGFVNFTPVSKGQLLAADRRGDLRAHRDSLLLLPSYQGLGDDGYFLGRRVRRFWLRLSAALRRLKADRLLPLLPGVRRDAARPDVLLAHPSVARYLVVQIFHLFGYRRRRHEGHWLVFSRRPEGRWP